MNTNNATTTGPMPALRALRPVDRTQRESALRQARSERRRLERRRDGRFEYLKRVYD